MPIHTAGRGVLPDPVPAGETVDVTCRHCQVVFSWTSQPPYELSPSYCSKNCKNRAARARVRTHRFALDALDAAEPAAGQLRLLVCTMCEGVFGWAPLPDSSDNLPPLYCSVACKERAKRHRKRVRIDAVKAARGARREARVIVEAEQARRAAEAERVERIAAVAAASRELLLPATHCARCNKVASPTREAAKQAKRDIEARSRRRNEVRYYECPDGFWHWTSQV